MASRLSKPLCAGDSFGRRTTWHPAGEYQGTFAPANVAEDLSNHGRLRDEPDDAHRLSAPAQLGVGLVDAADKPGPRPPAFLEPPGILLGRLRWRFVDSGA
jgi:hypothetical protein